MIRPILLALAAICSLTFGAQAQSVRYGYCQGNTSLVNWGTEKVETYNVAIRIDDASLTGSKVTAIRVPLNAQATSLTDGKVFITRQLKQSAGAVVADVCLTDFTPTAQQEWTEVALAEPFVMDGQPFYAGFSITVGSVDNEADKRPLRMALGSHIDGLYVGTSRTYRKWIDRGVELSRALPLELVIEGDLNHSNAAGITQLDKQQVKRGAISKVRANLINYGNNDIEEIDYRYEVTGYEHTGHIHLDEPLSAQYFGSTRQVEIEVPALPELGDYEGTLTLTSVNGEANANTVIAYSQEIEAVRVVVKKRPLLEEFTGTWCGWCPRGLVGLMLLNERYPNDFVGASYHNADIMSITNTYPVEVPALPGANLDRCHQTDAYRGDFKRDMGIEETWLTACQESTCANVMVTADLDELNRKIEVHATYEFAVDQEDANYGVAYMVTADSLHGSGANWIQSNYFPQSSDYGPEMDFFTNGTSYIYVVYDDVVIAQSGNAGATITGVIPQSLHVEDTFQHTYTFDVNTMNSILDGSSLVQNIHKLNVIALLYDRTEHKVVNCAKAHAVAPSGDQGIALAPDAQRRVVGYYSLDGKPLSAPARHGICIATYSDGTQQVRISR